MERPPNNLPNVDAHADRLFNASAILVFAGCIAVAINPENFANILKIGAYVEFLLWVVTVGETVADNIRDQK